MLVFYRIYQIIIAIPLLIAITAIAAIITIICTLPGWRWAAYWPAHIWAKLFCWLNLVTVKVEGRQNVNPKTSYVFVANHQGAFDIFSIYGFLGHDFKWMMKKSLRKIPLVGYSCYRAGHIFVDRKSASGIRQTMATAQARLKGGASIVVFPEGARTPDGHMKPFKKGAYQLALQFHLPLVPVTVDGSYRVMPRKAILPRWGRINLTIHHPIDAPVSPQDKEAAIEETAKAIRSRLPANNS